PEPDAGIPALRQGAAAGKKQPSNVDTNSVLWLFFPPRGPTCLPNPPLKLRPKPSLPNAKPKPPSPPANLSITRSRPSLLPAVRFRAFPVAPAARPMASPPARPQPSPRKPDLQSCRRLTDGCCPI